MVLCAFGIAARATQLLKASSEPTITVAEARVLQALLRRLPTDSDSIGTRLDWVLPTFLTLKPVRWTRGMGRPTPVPAKALLASLLERATACIAKRRARLDSLVLQVSHAAASPEAGVAGKRLGDLMADIQEDLSAGALPIDDVALARRLAVRHHLNGMLEPLQVLQVYVELAQQLGAHEVTPHLCVAALLWALGYWRPVVERIEMARDEARFSLLTRDPGRAPPAHDAPRESVVRWFKRLEREGRQEHERVERARRRRAELLEPLKLAESSGVVEASMLTGFAAEIRLLSRDRRKPDPARGRTSGR